MQRNQKPVSREKRKKHRGRGFIGVVLVLLLVFVSLTSVYSLLCGPVSVSSDEEIAVTIREGESTEAIGKTLKKRGLIHSAFIFKVYSRLHRYSSAYQAGGYAFSPSMSLDRITSMMKNGETSDVSVTITEGQTEFDVARKLEAAGLVRYDSFVKRLEDEKFRSEYGFLSGAQTGKYYLEGYLFPNTYQIPAESSDDDIIRTFLDGYSAVFTDEMRERAKSLGYSENQIVIIASIIERESGRDEDRAKIASVIYNRMKQDMPLQMDSTVSYAINPEGTKKMTLSEKDTQFSSPYNTYLRKGLPAGPICSPGKASIMAALYPETTDYLYFVLSAKLDGSTVFSKDYATFKKNSDAYYAALKKANG